jgi:hypothetical protein
MRSGSWAKAVSENVITKPWSEIQVMGSVLTCVVASCKVVCCVFFAADELFGVEQLAVSTGPDLIDDGRFQIQEHGAWDVLSGTGLTEKRVEGVVSATNCFVAWHLSIRLQKTRNKKP